MAHTSAGGRRDHLEAKAKGCASCASQQEALAQGVQGAPASAKSALWPTGLLLDPTPHGLLLPKSQHKVHNKSCHRHKNTQLTSDCILASCLKFNCQHLVWGRMISHIAQASTTSHSLKGTLNHRGISCAGLSFGECTASNTNLLVPYFLNGVCFPEAVCTVKPWCILYVQN